MEEGMELTRLLSSFSCEHDEDIENFLHHRAVEFENLSKSRTYLICDQEQLEKEEPDKEPLKIYGYISVALKILSVPESASNVPKESVSGEQLIGFACDVIAAAVDAVGGRYMMIECHDNEKLVH